MATETLESNGEKGSGALGDYFDRVKRALDGKPGVTHSKLHSIEVKTFFELSQQWTVLTARQRDESEENPRSRDTVFLTFLGREGSLRLVVPSDVVDTIVRQRDQLTKKARKRAAKTRAAALKASGYKPTFKKKQKEGV